MGRIRLGIAAAVVEAVRPVLGRVLSEGIDVGNLVRIEPGPQSPIPTKMRDAALHRDAGAGEGDTDAGPFDERGRHHQLVFSGGGHRRPAKRSSSGTGASTELRTRSKVSSDHAFGPSASLSFRNQLSSGIWVRCARMAPSFLSMNWLTSSQVVTRSSDTAKGGGSPSVENRFSTPARCIASAICRISDFGKAE